MSLGSRAAPRPPRLIALATAVPPHAIGQQEARRFAALLFERMLAQGAARLLEVFDHAEIETRYSCMPIEWFSRDHDFAEKNALYIERGLELTQTVAQRALERAGLVPRDVDHLVFVSSTGLATPSLDARLANRMGLRSDFHRTPIWGLGCAGGAAGLARARDFALADPRARVLLVALELCTLTFQRNDLSKRNLVAASLFGDGAAAAVIVGADAPAPATDGARPLALLDSQSTLWPDTLDVMGWEVDGAGLHVVFSRDIPSIVREKVRPGLECFLARQGLGLGTVDHVVAHPGGAKVLRAYRETLGLGEQAFAHAHRVLREYGNMSSPTCLFVLECFRVAGDIGAGESAVLAALGPGFSAEYVLARGEAV